MNEQITTAAAADRAPAKADYRLKCEIVDQVTGETIIADFTYLSAIDEYGGCESVDMTVARILRQFRTTAQRQYERQL